MSNCAGGSDKGWLGGREKRSGQRPRSDGEEGDGTEWEEMREDTDAARGEREDIAQAVHCILLRSARSYWAGPSFVTSSQDKQTTAVVSVVPGSAAASSSSFFFSFSFTLYNPPSNPSALPVARARVRKRFLSFVTTETLLPTPSANEGVLRRG